MGFLIRARNGVNPFVLFKENMADLVSIIEELFLGLFPARFLRSAPVKGTPPGNQALDTFSSAHCCVDGTSSSSLRGHRLRRSGQLIVSSAPFDILGKQSHKRRVDKTIGK